MGRIKTRLVKSLTEDMLEQHGEKFGTTFEENKPKVAELVNVKSKKMRNIIAGYATRITKAASKQ